MAYLFIVENDIAKPNTEVLLLEPFKTIWERDKSEGKLEAIKEFTFIEFMSSKKKSNPYAGYDEQTRFLALRDEMFDSDWEMDDEIKSALKKVEQFQIEASPTYQYYMSALTAAGKMRRFFNEFDINERNEKTGNPIYKPSDITRALNDTDKVLHNLNSMKEKVEQELFDNTKTRGNKDINPFEM